jgi:hypothetical protein
MLKIQAGGFDEFERRALRGEGEHCGAETYSNG